MNYRNNSFISPSEENAAEEAASGLHSVEKLIRLFSSQNQKAQSETDYVAVADVAVNKFKKVISLLGRTRTGHARFRRAPLTANSPASSSSSPNSVLAEDRGFAKIYCPTPIQQLPPPDYKLLKDSPSKTITFSYSPPNSFISSLTEANHPPSSSAAFQIIGGGSLSHHQLSTSAGKPPLSSSSSFKRKCVSSENGASGKCSGSSSRCHCSKRR